VASLSCRRQRIDSLEQYDRWRYPAGRNQRTVPLLRAKWSYAVAWSFSPSARCLALRTAYYVAQLTATVPAPPRVSVAARKANIELEMRRLGLLSPATLALLLRVAHRIGTTNLQHEINLNANGLRTPGKVVDLVMLHGRSVGASAVFEVVPPGAPPWRVQVSGASSLHDWDKGIKLNLVCSELCPEAKWCEVDTFADRWL
jgi:hypothetical protein